MRLHHRTSGHDGPGVVGVEGHGRAQLFERQLVLASLHVHQAQGGAKLRVLGRIAEKSVFFYLQVPTL